MGKELELRVASIIFTDFICELIGDTLSSANLYSCRIQTGCSFRCDSVIASFSRKGNCCHCWSMMCHWGWRFRSEETIQSSLYRVHMRGYVIRPSDVDRMIATLEKCRIRLSYSLVFEGNMRSASSTHSVTWRVRTEDQDLSVGIQWYLTEVQSLYHNISLWSQSESVCWPRSRTDSCIVNLACIVDLAAIDTHR